VALVQQPLQMAVTVLIRHLVLLLRQAVVVVVVITP
jgi:hypothetical protein